MTVFKKIIITAIRNINFLLFFILYLLLPISCSTINQDDSENLHAGGNVPFRYRIQEIQDRGKLIAITDYSSTDYFIYRGAPMGFQYEKLKSFADYLGVGLEVKVARDEADAYQKLIMGDVDLVAMGLTVTQEKAEQVDFTEPILQTRQMLVQRKPANWRKMRTWDDIEHKLIRNPLELAGKTVTIEENSAYANRLNNLSEEIGKPINVIEEPGQSIEQIVEQVSKGEIEYTICGEYMANFFERIYPDLDIKTAISFPQNLAWAVRHDSDSLESVVNDWLVDFNKSLTGRYLVDKYYNSPRIAYMARSEHVSFNGGKISRYDDILQELSRKYNFDWRLMASLVYQESQFHPDVKSWAGAYGLMQLMPATAELFGIDSTSSDREQLEAGIKYLKALDQELPKEIRDPDERIKFILAAYNVGIAHIYDARRLAEKNGKDPNVWKDNVDYYILNKSNPKIYNDDVVRYGYARGEETYNFVNEVLDRWEHYKNVFEN